MSETNDRIERLEREIRRLSGWILVLAVAFVTTFALGMARGRIGELKMKKMIIVDAAGKERIVASTTPDGAASLVHYDRDGKERISTATTEDDTAIIRIFDSKKKMVWGETSAK